MTDPSQLPIEQKLRAAAQATEPKREFSETLWRQISASSARASKQSPFWRILSHPAWDAAMVLVVAALVVAILGPQKVVTAFSSLFGYLPGVGFVQKGSGTLYLATPVAVQQGDIHLTVDQAVADQENTVIAYHIEGLPASNPGAACVYDQNLLRLPDGRTLHPTGGGLSDNQARITYQPLPEGVTSITLLAAMDPAAASVCSLPAELDVQIAFVPMPPETTLMPVFAGEEVQPAGPAANQVANATELVSSAPAGEADPFGISLSIERVAELADGYLVVGQIHWQDDGLASVDAMSQSLEVTDANGTVLPIQPSDQTNPSDSSQKASSFAIDIQGKDFAGPLTLKLHTVTIMGTLEDGPTFSFDTSADPQVGQTWPIDQTLSLFGREVTIVSARAIHDPNNNFGTGTGQGDVNAYELKIQSEPGLHFVGIQPDKGLAGTDLSGTFSSQTNPGGDTEITQEIGFFDQVPTGELSFKINGLNFQMDGAWQTTWQLPAEEK